MDIAVYLARVQRYPQANPLRRRHTGIMPTDCRRKYTRQTGKKSVLRHMRRNQDERAVAAILAHTAIPGRSRSFPKAWSSATYNAARTASWFRSVRAGSLNRSTSTTMIER